LEPITINNKVYDDYCSICGFAITQHERGASIEGFIVDYIMKDKGKLDIVLCVSCRDTFFEICKGGEEAAIKRTKNYHDSS
jgi:hypothetical protein